MLYHRRTKRFPPKTKHTHKRPKESSVQPARHWYAALALSAPAPAPSPRPRPSRFDRDALSMIKGLRQAANDYSYAPPILSLVGEKPTCSSRFCKDATVYDLETTAMHDNEWLHPPPPLPPSHVGGVSSRSRNRASSRKGHG